MFLFLTMCSGKNNDNNGKRTTTGGGRTVKGIGDSTITLPEIPKDQHTATCKCADEQGRNITTIRKTSSTPSKDAERECSAQNKTLIECNFSG